MLAAPASHKPLSDRARFVSVEDGFNIARPVLTPCSFDAESDRALDGETKTGFILLDRSHVLLTPYPATTPLLLAKFLRILPDDQISATPRSSVEIFHVLEGQGVSVQSGGEGLTWGRGDIFSLPGGTEIVHSAAGHEPAVIFSVSDQPLIEFLGAKPAPLEDAPVEAVHYPADIIAGQISALCARAIHPDTPGRALFLASIRTEAMRTCAPALTLTLNAVLPGERQRPHRHNAAAIVFVMQGGPVHSVIGGKTMPWRRGSVLLTPPDVVHSHESTGNAPAVALIVQDGALHYYCRTMSFSFA